MIAAKPLALLVVHVPFLNDAFDISPLSAGEWTLCAAMASSVLWLDELKKLIGRGLSPTRR